MINQALWFPGPFDKFITHGNDLCLYEAKLLNQEFKVNLLERYEKYPFIKCAETIFHQNQLIVALGLCEKVVLHFTHQPENNLELILKPNKYAKCLKWKDGRLAFGLDKYNESAVSVWDIGINTITSSVVVSDPVTAVEWNKNDLLLAGLGGKCIKGYDLRAGIDILNITTKSTYCIEVDPHNEFVVSGLCESGINFYDLRALEKPLFTITNHKLFSASKWNQHSRTLGVIFQDSNSLNCYDIHEDAVTSSPYPFLRNYFPYGIENKNKILQSISWHPNLSDRLLCLTTVGTLKIYKIPCPSALAFDHNDSMWVTEGASIDCKNNKDNIFNLINDNGIEEMKLRALKGYGFLPDIEQNGLLGHPDFQQIWKLLGVMQSKGCLHGFKSFCAGTNADWLTLKSDVVYVDWRDCPSMPPLKSYKSDQRILLQHICGWTFNREDEDSFRNFIDEMCLAKNFIRAALISVFHLKIKQAIETLVKSNDNVLQVVGIALNIEKLPMSTVDMSAVYSTLENADLRCLFSFIFEEEHRINKVLSEKSLPLCDRIAFASLYLPDNQLHEYLRSQIQICVEQGDLNGIFLTGITSDGVSLLQNFLDKSKDTNLDTVATIAARFFTNDQYCNFKIQYWITTYRNLLDRWGLFKERVQFDNLIGSKKLGQRPIFLLCNFCGKNMSAAFQEEARLKAINRCSACPYCRKPLPRCSLCLQHMGTSSIYELASQNNDCQHRSFSNWFALCMKCKHSGHTMHLMQWFKNHPECPIVGCYCRCIEEV